MQLVNCKRMQVQVKNVVPSIAVDKTDGCVVYLSYASRGTQITTSKISEVNVSFPNSEAEDADWVRRPPSTRTHEGSLVRFLALSHALSHAFHTRSLFCVFIPFLPSDGASCA